MKNQKENSIDIKIFLLVLSCVLISCTKFLEEKPDKRTVIITKVSDLQAILDNEDAINNGYNLLTTAAADEYQLTQSDWQAKKKNDRDSYIWDASTDLDAWTVPYQIVYNCNVVLSELDRVDGDQNEKDYVKGQALFHRAFAFYQVAQLYCPPYSVGTLNDLGIVIRTSPNIEDESGRGTVSESYARIIADLKEAETLLPTQMVSINRPNKISTYGMLARAYLAMGDYENADHFADLYLENSSGLIDFNTLNQNANPAINKINQETIYYASMSSGTLPADDSIADDLYASYSSSDLRKAVYFHTEGGNIHRFKGSYSGVFGYYPFCGIVTDEMYLTRAECRARSGNINDAMNDLNTLLVTRWKANEFSPFTATDRNDALRIILKERRKELVFRGTRWTDLRRLNLEGANITLTRTLGDQVYSLPPNDERWVWLIPSNVISLSGIQQNPR